MKSIVVYATDENYVKLTAVSMYSLLKSNPLVDIAVFTDCISAQSESLLTGIARRFDSTVKLIDANQELGKLQSQNIPGYTSYSVYSRYIAAQKLAEEYDRFLQVDSDTLITGSIAKLLNLPMNGKAFAIGFDCIHNSYKKIIDLKAHKQYFNCGIFLVDIKKWIERECSERFFSCLAKNKNKTLILPDQDIVAHCLADDAIILPPQYNFLTHFQMFKTRNDVLRATGIPASAWYTEEQYAAARKNPVIHHFLGHTLGRPWYKESLNPLRPLYRQIAAEAGFPEVAEQSRPTELEHKILFLAWKTLPHMLFSYACRAMYSYFFRTRYGV